MNKTPLQIVDSTLFLYSSLITFFLVISGLLNLNKSSSLLVLLILFPVAIYFAVKTFSITQSFIQDLLNLDQGKNSQFDHFSLSAFIHQADTLFLVNILLLCFAVALILFRISLQTIQ